MAVYKTPGVYVEEIPKFPPSVAPVETAIPAFIGYTEFATEQVADDLILKPRRITSLVQYEQFFGFPQSLVFLGRHGIPLAKARRASAHGAHAWAAGSH